MKYDEMDRNGLLELEKTLKEQYEAYKAMGLKLDMSRGKPSNEQLDLSMGMLDTLHSLSDYMASNNIDVRNYGCLDGLPEAKRLMADVMETRPENVIIFCDSSLNIMYDLISKGMTHGVMGSTPWMKLDKVKFLCPVPGYDRHFAITEYFGIEMINIPMLSDGPDMDMIEELVKDEAVKGIWCVPKYSNPTGTVYSDEVVNRFAWLKPAAEDFRIYWDNAYNVHHLDFDRIHDIPEILELCEKAGNPDLVYKFGSFSKISFSGSSIAALATSENNIADVLGQMKFQTIGHNKINQLRHARFFRDKKTVMEHMKKHAKIMKPKFDCVQEVLDRDLSGTGTGNWTRPEGGYFISFDSMEGCAKKIVQLMKEAGVTLTNAGATFPYGKDPEDRNIRLAPSFVTVKEIRQAMEVFTTVVRLVSVEKLLEK
ncbi:MAG: aminotransferase class I/II-fold pyridoxal phosphate-dependent enzyme [Lachnospiraceae bacterium]|nr:aminotransferase class I/II-fold pyridoxal phosphate-dependent enzyme [Lachnospiraceae bacterium]